MPTIKDLFSIIENEKSYRKNQIIHAIFEGLIENFDEAQNLPKELREKLNTEFPLNVEAKLFISDNLDTEKALITLEDGKQIETVLMRHKDRNSICVSSQIGCSLGCEFCATGKMGFIRQLTDWEILLQVLFFARRLKKENQKINSIVFMGMGEPMFNYENVIAAIRILNDKDGFNLGARHISISTSGIIEGIRKLADENLQINLAVSLHSSSNEIRSKIMPINNKVPIQTLMQELKDYIEKTGRKVMIEYLMLKGINDSEYDAKKLAELLKKYSYLFVVNLIKYNPTGDFTASENETIQKFKETLKSNRIDVTERRRFGKAINAACGQLATNCDL